ncbi:MAG: hypothetical protein ABWX92_07000, partial [Mycetocola sp.]
EVTDGVDVVGDHRAEKSCREKIWSVHVGSLPSGGILGIDLALLKNVHAETFRARMRILLRCACGG